MAGVSQAKELAKVTSAGEAALVASGPAVGTGSVSNANVSALIELVATLASQIDSLQKQLAGRTPGAWNVRDSHVL